jgi:hypothetical protein
MKISFPLFASYGYNAYGHYIDELNHNCEVHVGLWGGSFRTAEVADNYFEQPGHGKENLVCHAKLNNYFTSGNNYYVCSHTFCEGYRSKGNKVVSCYSLQPFDPVTREEVLDHGRIRYGGTYTYYYYWMKDSWLYRATYQVTYSPSGSGRVSFALRSCNKTHLFFFTDDSSHSYTTSQVISPDWLSYAYLTFDNIKFACELQLDAGRGNTTQSVSQSYINFKYRYRNRVFDYVPSAQCNARELFRYSEYALAVGYSYPVFRNSIVQEGRQAAFLNAADHFPKLNDNMISNIIDIVKFIVGLCKGKINFPKNPKDAWLSYRYSYSTSKLDLEEAISYLDQRSSWSQVFQSYGVAHIDDVQFRCKIKAHSRVLSSINQIKKYLNETGLEFDPYVLWDMIPYSFVIDWALPIGEILSLVSNRKDYSQSYYDYDYVIYSISYNAKKGEAAGHCYTRWIEGTPPALVGFYELENNHASKKTKLKRTFDAFALFT